MYDALDVARFVIEHATYNGCGISNLKLQKVLYFIQAEFMVSTGKPCFKEKIEAWDFGPVVPEVFHEYSAYGGNWIPVLDYIFETDKRNLLKVKKRYYDRFAISAEDKERIAAMVDSVKDYSATDLLKIVHNQKPWMDAWAEAPYTEITPKSLRQYFIS